MTKAPGFKTTRDRNAYIIRELNTSLTIREVSGKVPIGERQIKRIRKTYRVNGKFSRKKGSGRPHALNKAQKLRVVQTVRWNFGRPLSAIVRDLNLRCSLQSVRNYLHSAGYTYKKSQKRNYLTYQDHQERLFFAESYRDWNWTTIIFVDESVFRVGEPCYGWCPKGHVSEKEVTSHPPSVGVWAAISMLGKLSLDFYEGALDQWGYQDILSRRLYR